MKQRSRTEYSLINIFAGLAGYGINTVVGFVCRIIFVRTLSADYLGVSGLFTNILSMLSLAEMGISSAITYALYKPLAEGDEKKTASIMQFYRKAYAAIGGFVALMGLAMLPFLRVIIVDPPQIKESIYLLLLFQLPASHPNSIPAPVYRFRLQLCDHYCPEHYPDCISFADPRIYRVFADSGGWRHHLQHLGFA